MKQMIRILVGCAVLMGCATPEEIEARRQWQEENDIETCKGYGLRPRSEAFGTCLMQLDLERQRRAEANYYYGGYYPHHRFGSSIYYMNR